MKFIKLILAGITAAALTGTALAETKISVGGELGRTHLGTQAAGAEQWSLSQTVRAVFDNGLGVDFLNVTTQNDKNASGNYGAVTQWQELGLTYTLPVANITKVFARVNLSMYEKTNYRYFGHGEEIGITDRIGNTPFSYRIGYRKVDSFSDVRAYNAENEQYRFTIGYKISDKHSVYVRRQFEKGQWDYTQTNVGYSYTF